MGLPWDEEVPEVEEVQFQWGTKEQLPVEALEALERRNKRETEG